MLDLEELRKIEKLDISSEIWRYYLHFKKFVTEKEKTQAEQHEKKTQQSTAEGGATEQIMQEAEHEEEKTQSTAEGGATEQIMQEAEHEEEKTQSTAEGSAAGPNSKKAATEKEKELKIRESALELLNEFLYKSLSNLIDVIVRACVRNRCWIVVEGGPNGGLLLLKQAAERCNERPIILVVDSLKKKRYPYKEVRDFIQAHKDKLEAAAKVPVPTLTEMARRGAKPEQVTAIAKAMAKRWQEDRDTVNKGRKTSIRSKKSEHSSGQNPQDDKWKLEDQEKVEEIKVQSAIMTSLVLESARPINQPIVEPLQLSKYFKFWKLDVEEEGWACKSHKDQEADKVRWNKWHFRGGTHYIFTEESYKDLVLDCLAPSGCIFLGGGDSSKKELLNMLVSGQPVVCVNHTGRLTQDFVRCHEFLCQQLFRVETSEQAGAQSGQQQRGTKQRSIQRSERSSLDELESQERPNFLREKTQRRTLFSSLIFDGHQGADHRTDLVEHMMHQLSEVTSFSQPEMCELLITYLRRGQQIPKLCIVMDPLNPRECSGGHTEDKLSMCLSNFVILASNDTSDFADVEAVKAASVLESQLLEVAKVEQWWAVIMIYMLVVLNLLSLLLALVRSGGAAASYAAWLPEGLRRWGLPAVSALSTFISGLVARFRFTLRWSKALSAASHLQAEIWKFRTRVSDYTVVGGSGVAETEDAEGGRAKSDLGQVFTRERKQDEARSLFRANVTNIFNSAMEEMGTSSLHNGGFDKLPNPRQGSGTERKNLYGTCGCRCCCRKRTNEKPSDKDKASSKDSSSNKAEAPEQEVFQYGHLGIDEYYEQRTLEVLARMKNQAFWLTFKQGALESFVLLFGTAGVLLSTFDQTELAMVCVSLAASLQSLERFHALSTRLDAANAGERDMICAWQEWSAMEPMQRRFQSHVSRLVLTTEGVNVALTSAATAGVRQSLAKPFGLVRLTVSMLVCEG